MERQPDNRLDVHNAAIDIELAEVHLCGTTDLRTGRTCIGPARHPGGCQFVPKDDARDYALRARAN